MIPILVLPRKAKPLHVDVGDGMDLKKISGRHLLGVRSGGRQKFEGSWWVRVKPDGGSFQVTVDRGYVNSLEPTIGGVPISGVLDGEPVASGQPYLTFSGGGMPGWVCLKITPNKSGKLDAISGKSKLTSSVTVEIGRGISGKSAGDSWFYPIASISQYGKVAQFAYFDISYKAYKKGGDQKWRHRISLEALTWRNLEEIIAEDEAIRKVLAA